MPSRYSILTMKNVDRRRVVRFGSVDSSKGVMAFKCFTLSLMPAIELQRRMKNSPPWLHTVYASSTLSVDNSSPCSVSE